MRLVIRYMPKIKLPGCEHNHAESGPDSEDALLNSVRQYPKTNGSGESSPRAPVLRDAAFSCGQSPHSFQVLARRTSRVYLLPIQTVHGGCSSRTTG